MKTILFILTMCIMSFCAYSQECKDCNPIDRSMQVSQTLNAKIAWKACDNVALVEVWKIQVYVLSIMPTQLPVFGHLRTEMHERKMDNGTSLYYVYIIGVWNTVDEAKVIIHGIKDTYGSCELIAVRVWQSGY